MVARRLIRYYFFAGEILAGDFSTDHAHYVINQSGFERRSKVGIVYNYYIFEIANFIDFMSLFRHIHVVCALLFPL